MSTRRAFLQSAGLASFAATAPRFVARTAQAAAPHKDAVLVVVQLTGGNDGLNTVVPFADPEYAKARPTIGLKRDAVKKLTDAVGFHPAMAGLAELYETGAVGVVQGVGYPNPSQSHFRSMDVWHAASTAETLTDGWLGRAMGKAALPGFHLAASGTESAPLALTGAPARVPSLASLADFQLKAAAPQKSLIAEASRPREGTEDTPGLLDFVQRTATATYASSDKLSKLGAAYTPKVPYPTSRLGDRLKLAAQLIDAGVGARVFYVAQDGYDTHAGQGGATGGHATLLGDLSAAVTAFHKDVSARGHGDRVLVLTFSEFGRRAKENGSAGTDHGAAAPMLLVGGRVKAGVQGDHPSLTALDEGNLRHSLDFRRVYAGVLRDWLKLDPAGVLGKGFDPLPVVRV
jgi:uncharacterized protein (DUF1501 family)